MMIIPTVNAITTEMKIPAMIRIALLVLIYVGRLLAASPIFTSLKVPMATAEPSNSKTMETVVEVGRPTVLKKSSNRIHLSASRPETGS
jgi:hypothetical protein